jgi:hypothetical protein
MHAKLQKSVAYFRSLCRTELNERVECALSSTAQLGDGILPTFTALVIHIVSNQFVRRLSVLAEHVFIVIGIPQLIEQVGWVGKLGVLLAYIMVMANIRNIWLTSALSLRELTRRASLENLQLYRGNAKRLHRAVQFRAAIIFRHNWVNIGRRLRHWHCNDHIAAQYCQTNEREWRLQRG